MQIPADSTSTLTLTGSVDDSASRSIRTGNTAQASYGAVGFVEETGLLAGPTNYTRFTGLNDASFSVALTGLNNNGFSAIQIVQQPSAGTPYDTWAATHAGGQTADLDFDNEYFMGETGATFTSNPTVENGTVTWPHVGVVTSFEVQVSANLTDWSPADPGDLDTTTDPGLVVYTLPTGATQLFCRLVVTP